VQVEACGVCYRDLIDREGRYPFQRVPITPGHEAVGRVIAIGDRVTRWRIGDRVGAMHRDACNECAACLAGETTLCQSAAFVFGILADGGYASHLSAPESAFYALPDDLPASTAAVYQCTFGTAWRGLNTVAAKAGERILITGANGGVGAAAIQLVSRIGAQAIAVVRDQKQVEFVRSLGATEVLVGDQFHRQLRGIDAALECVGQPTFNATLRTLRIGGRVVVIGNVVNIRAELNLGYVIVNALRIYGSSGANAKDMASLIALGRFQMPIFEELELGRADEAQRRVRAGGLRGRIVLRP
jgi:D-arabinose 1-dehydrogenase-like Zn-dependent alcohol dehydrogenase